MGNPNTNTTFLCFGSRDFHKLGAHFVRASSKLSTTSKCFAARRLGVERLGFSVKVLGPKESDFDVDL